MTVRSLIIALFLSLFATPMLAITPAEGRQCAVDALERAQRDGTSMMEAVEQYISFTSVAANAHQRSSLRNTPWVELAQSQQQLMVDRARGIFSGDMVDTEREIDINTVVIGRGAPAGTSIEVPGRFTNEHGSFEHFSIWVVRQDGRCFAVDIAYQGIRLSLVVGREF